MASLIRPALFASRAVRATPFPSWAGAAGMVSNFASSSRVKLDSTRFLSTPAGVDPLSTSTSAVEPIPPLEDESDADRSVASHVTPSSSNPIPEPIPNHQIPPLPKQRPTESTSSAFPPLKPSYIPQFTRQPIQPEQPSPYAGLRYTPETPNVDYIHLSSNQPPTHTLHIRSTRNNVLLTFTDGLGALFGTVTAGTDRTFKNAQRSSYEAATQAAVKMFGRIAEWAGQLPNSQRPIIRVSYNGVFGTGKEAVTTALIGPLGADVRRLISRVEDRTKVKIGGTRARKPRRL